MQPFFLELTAIKKEKSVYLQVLYFIAHNKINESGALLLLCCFFIKVLHWLESGIDWTILLA